MYTSDDGKTTITHNEFAARPRRDIPLGTIPTEVHEDKWQLITCYAGSLRVIVDGVEHITSASRAPVFVPKEHPHAVFQHSVGKTDFISVYKKY
jgi:hypothetical protein